MKRLLGLALLFLAGCSMTLAAPALAAIDQYCEANTILSKTRQ